MSEALVWLAGVEAVGLVAWPIAFTFLQRLPDRGHTLAKPLGLLLVTYLLWIGALAHVLPNTRVSIVLILLLVAAVSLLLLARGRDQMWAHVRAEWRFMLIAEVLFVLAFAAVAYYHSFVPEIGEGEEPMDFAYLNSILRSRYFPPEDPWLSGHPIPYYYFGHLMVAVLTKLTGISSSVAFNLGASMVAALAAAGAFGLVFGLVRLSASRTRAILYGFVGVLFLLVLSNLDGVFELMSVHGIGSRGFYSLLDINGLDGPRPSDAWYPTDLWWGRAQIISGPWDSHHFPFVAVLLGGLHAEYLSLPFVLLVLGIAFNLLLTDGVFDYRFLRNQPLRFLLIALAVGALAFVDSWAFPTFALFLIALVFLRNYLADRHLSLSQLVGGAGFALPLLAVALLLFLPYFPDAPKGNGGLQLLEVAFIPGWPRESAATRPNHFFLYFLPLLWIPVSFALFALSGSLRRVTRRQVAVAFLPALIPFVIWAVGVTLRHQPGGFLDEVEARYSSWPTLAILAVLITVISLVLVRALGEGRGEDSVMPLIFAVTAAAVGVYLIFGAELFWVKVEDAWVNRTPTTFRLSLHAWILLSIAGAYGLYFVLSKWRLRGPRARLGGLLWGLATAMVIAAGLVYPLIATAARTGGLRDSLTLDGLGLVRRFEPDEYAAVEWLNDNVAGGPVILEAPGPEYGPYARVSIRTGLPTILGWPSHELKFRGSAEPQAGRQEDMQRLYETGSTGEAQQLIDKYDVEYVYVGNLERQQYSQSSLDKFAEFMEVAFANDSVTIYRTPGR